MANASARVKANETYEDRVIKKIETLKKERKNSVNEPYNPIVARGRKTLKSVGFLIRNK